MLEIVHQVTRVFDTDTESDQVLGQTSSGSDCGRDGGVTALLARSQHVNYTITYDMRQGILIKLLTAPNDTLMPQSRVPPTIRSLSALSSVTKLKTAPAPVA